MIFRTARTALFVLVASLTTSAQVQAQIQAQVESELDAYWAGVIQAVRAGDANAYRAGYHPDAVLVYATRGLTRSIADDIAANIEAFADTREGRSMADLAFRFTRRMHNEDTAHEMGMFQFTSGPTGGEERIAYIHFEALLVKKDGKWLMTMEYQKSRGTEEEWEEAGR